MEKLIAVFIFSLSLVASSFALASEKEDADTLYALREAIEKVLPADWATEVTADQYTNLPSVRIFSKYPLKITYIVINASPDDPPDKEQLNVVELRVLARAYISPEQFSELKKQNDELTAQRIEFMKKLKGISYTHLGSSPIPPRCYDPKDAAQRRLITEYSAVWMRTESVRLPTHRFKNLSFSLDRWFDQVIRDDAKQIEFENLLKALGSILTPYEKQG